MRFSTPCVIVCSLAAMAAAAPSASAANTGGAGAPTTTAPAPAKPAVKIHGAPVTSRSTNIAYSGPVYEKTVTGEVIPYVAPMAASTAANTTGGSIAAGATAPTKPQLLVPGTRARYVEGVAAAPMSAPAAVQEIVWAGDQLIGLPYIYGGGHASFVSPGYDCSGTVSFALHGATLLETPMDSSEFESWGSGGVGHWVTIFSNAGHAYMTVAGLRLDTSAADDPSNEQGPRWRPLRPANEGFVVRHPTGL